MLQLDVATGCITLSHVAPNRIVLLDEKEERATTDSAKLLCYVLQLPLSALS